MERKKKYESPQIVVCDYISRNRLMIEIYEGSTDIALGKENIWDDSDAYLEVFGESDEEKSNVWQ